MRLKTLIVSIVVLAALAAIVAMVRRPAAPRAADSRIGQPLANQTVIEKASKLRVSDQGKTVTLHRQQDGSWKVANYFDLPADFSKLSRLVNDLTAAKLERLVTSNPERIARLEFRDTKIELLDGTDQVLWSLTLGKTADSGNGRFVQFGTEPKAYLASLSAWLDAEPKNWANSTLVDLKPEDIAKLEISLPDSDPVTFSRVSKEDTWTSDKTPDQQTINTDKVSSVLSSLTNVRFSDTVDPTDPKVAEARAQARHAKLTTFDGKTISLTFGRKPEEKKLKPPAPTTDDKSGPTALGTLSDAATGETKAPTSDPKLATPEYETIPAGPVFVTISHSDTAAPVNELMKKRAFQISDYTFTSLPSSKEDLFKATAPAEPAPAASAP